MKPLQSIVSTVLILVACSAHAQFNIVRNFASELTGGGTQNWNVMQDDEGLIYLANTRGLLCFDGHRWSCTPNASYTDLRAISLDKNHRRVYAGGSNELGYYDLSNRLAAPRYISLKDKWPKGAGEIGDVWNIHALGNTFVFQTKRHLAVYRDGAAQIKVVTAPTEVATSVVEHDRLIVLCYDGIYAFDGTALKRLPGELPSGDLLVRAMLPTDEGLLLVTDEHGIYRYDGQAITPYVLDITPFLIQNKVFCAAANGQYLAFGTIRNGLVVKDMKTGRCEYSNLSTGLQNNTVLSVRFDHWGNVWMGLDYGVAYLVRDLPFMSLMGENLRIGRGYASLVDGSRLYLATNQGLYVTSYPLVAGATPPDVQPINSVTGQVWCLRKTSAGILCGCDQGVMLVNGTLATHLAGPGGTWDFRELKHHPGLVLGCDYSGFFVMRNNGSTLSYVGRVKGIEWSSANFEEDADGTIWACHWQKGIYHLWLNEEGTQVVKQEHFTQGKGLLVEGGNLVCKMQDTVFVSSVDGFWRYDRSAGKLAHVDWLNRMVNHYGNAAMIHETPWRDAWVFTGENILLLKRRASGTFDVDSTTYQGGTSHVAMALGHMGFPDSAHTIFNANKGFYLANQRMLQTPKSRHQVMIRRVADLNNIDSCFTTNHQGDKPLLVIPKDHNSIRVEYALPEYHGDGIVTYQCYLEGYDKTWGAEDTESSKVYTQLPKGTYLLHVRAHNHYDASTSETMLALMVLPAWYETWWAYSIYGILLAMGLGWMARLVTQRQRRAVQRIEDERNRQLKEQQMAFQIEKAHQEREVMEARTTQLEHDLMHKTSELGDFTMNLMRKNDMLQQLDDSLADLAESVKRDDPKAKVSQKVKAIRKSIVDNMNDDDNWDKFEENFNLVYDNFMAKLLAKFPDLHKNERKLCAYLRLGLSSKEIASLLNISLRSVETFRYRLRKKLGLAPRESITDFVQRL